MNGGESDTDIWRGSSSRHRGQLTDFVRRPIHLQTFYPFSGCPMLQITVDGMRSGDNWVTRFPRTQELELVIAVDDNGAMNLMFVMQEEAIFKSPEGCIWKQELDLDHHEIRSSFPEGQILWSRIEDIGQRY